ncbi:STAS/SEC14 domain-containing protein [Shewanella avicenniae]|uniref:STAS/SEC14 domain-containing protein n=1 Tax=Shewanella avicenniae TaxID=2814294 RepID=A0ABX7QTA8_9GAMM|nr:STAS/SEC14 domain-containing protein [Shewanella avicenniae]QSX34252.1 STAS/SEC14 domain-containing protein [Shewanella avicenniae]
MESKYHGISIGIEHSGKDDFYLIIKAIGTLTHQDYQMMVPVLEAALEKVVQPHIYCVVDITELDGWEARAMWDDLKLGVQHGREFRKIAVVGNRDWQAWMTKVADWFTPTEMEYFNQRHEAVAWLRQHSS